MDVEQQRRVAANEAWFRANNESIRTGIERFAGEEQPTELQGHFMCECAVSECRELLQMSLADYTRVRTGDAWFAVQPDHVISSAERVVERNENFWIVEKIGFGREVAESLAPD
jgi:hypothetical protein